MDVLGPAGATLKTDGVGDCVYGGTPWSLTRFLGRGSSGSELSNDARFEVLRGSGAGAGGMTGFTVDGAGDGAGTEPGRYSSLFGGDGT